LNGWATNRRLPAPLGGDRRALGRTERVAAVIAVGLGRRVGRLAGFGRMVLLPPIMLSKVAVTWWPSHGC